jgi:hypothetical protein
VGGTSVGGSSVASSSKGIASIVALAASGSCRTEQPADMTNINHSSPKKITNLNFITIHSPFDRAQTLFAP